MVALRNRQWIRKTVGRPRPSSLWALPCDRKIPLLPVTACLLLVCWLGTVYQIYTLQSYSGALFHAFEVDDGPPADLIVHGLREKYTAVPEEYRRRFLCEGKGAKTVTRAFRYSGWTTGANVSDVHILYQAKGSKASGYYEILQPWQRYSRVRGSFEWESKDGFLSGFQRYQAANPEHDLYFLPEAYRLVKESQQRAFQERLENGGRNRPWVLKKVILNNGNGIEILGPNSLALDTAVERALQDEGNDYVAQAFICNELTWFGGQKFDLRFYWLVASVDPPIVLYADGYARVGGGEYDETDFSDTQKHLTNHKFRAEESEVSKDHLWRRIREHYKANYGTLSKTIKTDPVRHVRNQMKEAVATLFAAFKDVFGSNATMADVVPENLFAFYGIDFIIDNDLDVYLIEAQASPGFGESFDYRVDMFRDLYRPIPNIVEEIAMKQAADARANILPLTNLGGYEIVYAGDWQYKYAGYERPANKKSCSGEDVVT